MPFKRQYAGKKRVASKSGNRKRKVRKSEPRTTVVKQGGSKFSKGNYTGFQVVERTRPFIGDILKTKMVYFASNIALNPGVGGLVVSSVWALNGLYDPDVAVGGHQPTGFDQYMAMYENYFVSNCKIVCSMRNSDATYTQIVGLYISRSSTPPSDFTEIIENGNGVSTILAPAVDSNTNCQAVFDISVNMAKEFGVPKNQLNVEDIFGGTASTNPTKLLYMHAWVGPAAGADTAAVGIEYLRLEFDVTFKSPKNLAIS